MLKVLTKLALAALMLCVAGLVAASASAADKGNVSATIATACTNCATDIANPNGDYSVKSDGYAYPGLDPLVISHFTPSNRVYTLDTSDTLVNGLVAPSTRTVNMHFYSPVECKTPGCAFPNDILPPCWAGNHNQDQAVNWGIFAPTSFVRMAVGAPYQGMARLNFNVREGDCDKQINRFRLEWGAVCITHPSLNIWTVTSGDCVATGVNYGEAHLQAYGGTKKNTVDYGDWRMPFSFTLTK